MIPIEDILRQAKECFTVKGFWRTSDESIEAFYRVAFNAGVEAAARVAYGTGDEQMEAQIRLLVMK